MLLAAFLDLSTIQFCSVFDQLQYAYCKRSNMHWIVERYENEARILPHHLSQLVDAYSSGQCLFHNIQ